MSIIDKPSVHIHFNISESCRCCGLIRPNNADLIYMNKYGEAEKFSTKKVTEDERDIHRRSLERLFDSLRVNLALITPEVDHYLTQVELDSGLLTLSKRIDKSPLTIGQIKRINQSLDKVLLELQQR